MAVLRRLGALETTLNMGMASGDLIYVQVFVVRSAEGRTALSARVVEAVQVWAMRHPLLRARVEVRPDGRYFVEMDDNDVRGAVYVRDDLSDWVQLAEEEMARPVDTSRGPLWRIHLGPVSEDKHVIMFTVDHAIMDAVNFMVVGFELLSVLNGRTDSLPLVEGVTPSLDQLVHQTDAYDGPPPDLDQAWLLPGNKIPPSFGSPSDSRCGWRVLPLQLDATASSRLLQASKQHSVKMNSTLSCIAAIAHARIYEANDEHIGPTVQVHTAVNVRSYLNVARHHLGCYVTPMYCRAVLSSSVDESLSAFWSMAKAMNDEFHRRLDTEVLEACKMDSLACQQLNSGVHCPDPAHFFLSNLGALSFPPLATPEEVVLEEAYFNGSLTADDWLVPIFHAVVTLNGRLFWAIGYHEKVVRTGLALDCRQHILTFIDHLTSELDAISSVEQ